MPKEDMRGLGFTPPTCAHSAVFTPEKSPNRIFLGASLETTIVAAVWMCCLGCAKYEEILAAVCEAYGGNDNKQDALRNLHELVGTALGEFWVYAKNV